MRKVIAVNAGSTSIKMAIFDDFALKDGQEKPLAEVRWEKDIKKLTIKFGKYKNVETVPFERHTEAFDYAIKCMQMAGSFRSKDEVMYVVNRAVNGGPNLLSIAPILITEEVQEEFKRNIDHAPNHNKPALEVSTAAMQAFPNAKHYYMFDTGWHVTMPLKNKAYALPKECYQDLGIRVYGAHGIVYMDNTRRAAKILNIPVEQVNLILLHFGGGCSLNAVVNGKSIDTTMGHTPTDGMLMASRVGHLDVGAFPDLMKKYGTIENTMEVLTKKSGFKGLTGETDMRNVITLAENGDEWAIMAIQKFVTEARKNIGAYMAEMDYNVDAIVCSGGILENDRSITREIFSGFEKAGVILSNNPMGLTAENSPIQVMVLEANEELAMTKAVLDLQE